LKRKSQFDEISESVLAPTKKSLENEVKEVFDKADQNEVKKPFF
jgi:hypothetical protein